MRALKLIVAVPIILGMIALAKIAQYASVDAFGARLGFDLASFVGVLPVLILYFMAAAKLPDPFRGKSRG